MADPFEHASGQRASITFDLAAGDTYPLLVNSLSAYADVLRRQSQDQSAWGEQRYADALARTAHEAEEMVRRVTEARRE